MKILDTTVRDGSYAVDFKFSCKDVENLVAKSSKIGIEYIEIGHGQGLGASSLEHGISLQTDVEYMEAARKSAGNSKLGCFCIPGIASLDDIRIAAENGMSFIRIGVPISKVDDSYSFVEKCNSLGIEPFVNFMKTYVASPEDFAIAASNLKKLGVEAVYIVDSAGSMLPNEIDEYFCAAREKSDVKIGFHGHNNLGLAVSNSLHCVQKGFEYIDCSFQGLGRSLGNASLEQVIMALTKLGICDSFDIPRVIEYGYAGLRNIVKSDLANPLDYMCGYAGFHSSFLKDIYKCSSSLQVDPLRLIMSYAEIDKNTLDNSLLEKIAKELPRDLEDNPYSFADYYTSVYNG